MRHRCAMCLSGLRHSKKLRYSADLMRLIRKPTREDSKTLAQADATEAAIDTKITEAAMTLRSECV